MRIFSFLTAITIACCVSYGPQSVFADWPQSTSYQPRVQVEMGGKAYDREGVGDNTPITFDASTNRTLLNADEISDLGSAAGMEGKVIFQMPHLLREAEFRILLSQWEEDSQISNANLDSPFINQGILSIAQFEGITLQNFTSSLLPAGLQVSDVSPALIPLPTTQLPPLGVPAIDLVDPSLRDNITIEHLSPNDVRNFFAANAFTTRYTSDLASVEFMTRRNVKPGLTCLFGPRFVSVQEEASISVSGSSSLSLFAPPNTGVSTALVAADAAARIHTRNSMIGLQGGLEYNMPITQDIYLQTYGRIGAYYNSAKVSHELSPLTPTALNADGNFEFQTTENVSGEAYLGEFGIRAYVDLIPNSVSAYAGFEGVYIDQLALAPVQALNLGQADSSSSTFMKALSFGVRMNY